METLLGQLDDFSGSKFGTGETIPTDRPPVQNNTTVQASKFGVPFADEAASKPTPTADIANEKVTDSNTDTESNTMLLLGAAALLFFLFRRK